MGWIMLAKEVRAYFKGQLRISNQTTEPGKDSIYEWYSRYKSYNIRNNSQDQWNCRQGSFRCSIQQACLFP